MKRSPTTRPRLALPVLALVAVLALPATAAAAPHGKFKAGKRGALTQLKGKRGCLVDRSRQTAGCGKARALKGPGPFMGSQAIAVSPDGKNVYVAASRSDAIVVFRRDPKTGALSQASGRAGCIAAGGGSGCATAIGLDGPNSVAVSPDGKNVYATSRDASSIVSFRRDRKTGALAQLPVVTGAGCTSALPIPGCTAGRALAGADVVAVSPDGANVYVGSFFGNAVAVFSRSTASRGALSQAAGSAGCIAAGGSEGCATGVALDAVEGLAVSRDGASVFAASALSGALAVLARDSGTGALSQAGGGSGCIAAALAGCSAGHELEGANAVATSPGNGVVYVTSLLANSLTVFQPTTASAGLTQKGGTAGCVVWLRSVGCGFGQAMSAPEGVAVSPDGGSVYVASFRTGALDVFDRNRETGSVAQKPGSAGCLAPKSEPICARGRALGGVSSIAISPDSRFVYTTSFFSNAVDVFRRQR